MLFMVIERFRDSDMFPIFEKVRRDGRQLPEGLEYIDSWVEVDFSRCFQLMRCDDPSLLQAWQLQWKDLGVSFETVPVTTSSQTSALLEALLNSRKA